VNVNDDDKPKILIDDKKSNNITVLVRKEIPVRLVSQYEVFQLFRDNMIDLKRNRNHFLRFNYDQYYSIQEENRLNKRLIDSNQRPILPNPAQIMIFYTLTSSSNRMMKMDQHTMDQIVVGEILCECV
jgi:hypothetical protein